MKILGIVAGLLLIASNGSSIAATIVTNGGFEDGGAGTGWQFYGAWGTLQTPAVNLGSYDGDWIAQTSCQFSCPLTQTLTTQAGEAYNLTFAYNAGYVSGPPGNVHGTDLQVYWGGTLVDQIFGGPLVWNTFSIDNLVAATDSTDLTFVANKVPSQIGLDDVAVAAVPEPATWTMFILGFGLIGWNLRSSRTRTLANQI